MEGSFSLKLVGCVTSAPKIMKGMVPTTGTAMGCKEGGREDKGRQQAAGGSGCNTSNNNGGHVGSSCEQQSFRMSLRPMLVVLAAPVGCQTCMLVSFACLLGSLTLCGLSSSFTLTPPIFALIFMAC